MSEERKQSIPKTGDTVTSFVGILEQALKHFRDPVWLGKNSPLATPYLLGPYLSLGDDTPKACGLALRQALEDAKGDIEHPIYAGRYQTIIEEYYFKDLSEQQVLDKVHLGRATFFENRKAAVQSLALALIKSLKPALRLETAPQVDRTLFGRQKQITECLQALRESETVLITGIGGIGKTTMASHLAHQWKQGQVFWFTVRPGFNDQLNSFLFALGHFLRQCGQPLLWSTLVARSGIVDAQTVHTRTVDAQEALGIIRDALYQLTSKSETPLLCIDDFDLLRPAENGTHGEIVNLTNGLRGSAPLLVIGQQALLETDQFYSLEGLTPAEAADMLKGAAVSLSSENEQQLFEYTQGNPRLLDLFIALYHASGSTESAQLSDVIWQLKKVPPLEYLLSHVLQRLPETERAILMDLSVYRNWAPADVWQHTSIGASFEALVRRRLVQLDARGGVAFLTAFREVVYQSLPQDKRARLHDKVAAVREARGAHTAAAHHLLKAGRPLPSFQLWMDHQAEEINQGQAAAGLQLLRDMLLSPLPRDLDMRDRIHLQCASLERLLGDPQRALEDIHSIASSTPMLAVEKNSLEGMIENDLGDFSHALSAYQRALTFAGQVAEARLAHIHKGLGWMHMRQRKMDSAWREAQLALYEAENISGFVLELRCEYAEAEQHYLAALELAKQLNDKNSVAKTCNNLSGFYGRQGSFETAKRYQQEADKGFAETGRTVDFHCAKINWAFIFNLNGEHEQARDALQEGIDYFTRSGVNTMSWPDTLFNQALAEAYLGIGDLDEAWSCVQRARQSEEVDVLPDSLRTSGEILLRRGRLDDAESLVTQSIKLCAENEDPYLEGFAWRALAQVHAAQGQQDKTAQAIAKAISLFEQIRLPFEVKRTEYLSAQMNK